MSRGLHEAGTDPAIELSALRTEIRRLYLRAGRPSLRQITKHAGPGVISHNTVSLVLKGQRVPSLAHALAVARVLGGDGARMRALWEAAAAAEGSPVSREPVEQVDEEPALLAALEDSARRSARLETMLGDALQRLGSLEQELAATGSAGLGPIRRPARLQVIEPGIETLPDRVFCIAHDRTGQLLCSPAGLANALAAAVIAELLLEGHVTLLIEGDAVVGFAVAGVPEDRLERYGIERLAEVLDRGGSWRGILASWLGWLRDGVAQEVTHRLTRSGVIQGGPVTTGWRRLCPTDEVEFTTPTTQLRAGLLAWDHEPAHRPDLRTCLLAALAGLLGIWLPGPGDPRVVHARMRAAAGLLPSPLRELLIEAGPGPI